MEIPQLSVIMGVYYHRKSLYLLKKSVESILDQSFGEFEFLICDDGSSSESRSFLDALAEKDRRVRLIRGAAAFDLATKLNFCLEHARAPLIARMDDDDFSHPDRFVRQLRALEAEPDIAFVGCCVDLYSHGRCIGQRILPAKPEIKDFLFTQPFIHPALVFRREALDAVHAYSEDRYCQLCEDYDLLLRLYEHGFRGVNIQESLLDYTLSGRKRTFRWRRNEAVTRWRRFSSLGLLPGALPYVFKPVILLLIPEPLLKELRKWHQRRDICDE